MIDDQLNASRRQRFLADDYGTSSFAEWAGTRLGVELNAKDYRGVDFESAQEEARREAESETGDSVREAIEENLPADAEPSEWNWQALLAWANVRYGLNLKDKDLRKFLTATKAEVTLDRPALEEFLTAKALETVQAVDLAPAAEFLHEDWGRRSLAGWVHHKFGLALEYADWRKLTKAEVVQALQKEARALYQRKEAEFPVRIGLTRYISDKTPGAPIRIDREGMAAWASERFHVELDAEELKTKLRPEIELFLVELAQRQYRGGILGDDLEARFEAAFGPASSPRPSPDAHALAGLAAWASENLGIEPTAEELAALPREDARQLLVNALDARHRPEMRELEKVLLLQILDNSWMEHLRAMDHLRSSVGLRGYAQVDPKVEYKREGMKIFEEMWSGVSDKVTDLIFRMEQFDPEFLHYLGSRWQLDRARTIHEAPTSEPAALPGSRIREQQEAAISASKGPSDSKPEPVRNTGRKVGRNDPCPCGSGKKFKACCMRKESHADLF